MCCALLTSAPYYVPWHVHRQTLGRLINSPGRSTSRPPIPPFLVPGSLASAFPTDRRPRTVFFGGCPAVSCTKMPDKFGYRLCFLMAKAAGPRNGRISVDSTQPTACPSNYFSLDVVGAMFFRLRFPAEPLVGTWPWRDAVPSFPRQGNWTMAYEQLVRPTMAQPSSLVPASRPGPGTCSWVPVPSSVGPWAEVMLHWALDT